MIKSDLGAVTAYADAVAHGYTGTREDFGKLLAGAGQNLADAAAAKDAAEAAADNAGSAAQTATDAAGTAGQAAGAATNAAGAASTSAGAAAQSAEAAETAQQGAENAAKKAVEAKTGAENALKDADTAKDAASGYADAATESATAAAASATNAAASASAAAGSAKAAAQTKAEVGTLGDEKKQALQDEGTAQQTAIEKKGQATLATIPENYTQTVQEVSQLKEDVVDLRTSIGVFETKETVNATINTNGRYWTSDKTNSWGHNDKYAVTDPVAFTKGTTIIFKAYGEPGVAFFVETRAPDSLTQKTTGISLNFEQAGVLEGKYTFEADAPISFSYITTKDFHVNIVEKTNKVMEYYGKVDDLENSINYIPMFRNIGIVGDSLSSGEIAYSDDSGNHFIDRFDSSWLSIIGRNNGINVSHYSQGGMTAKAWSENAGDKKANLLADESKNAYFIALGTNDISESYPLGNVSDTLSTNSFVGYFKNIIDVVHTKAPNAVVFLVSTYNNSVNGISYSNMILEIANLYDYCFFVDFVNHTDIYTSTGGVWSNLGHFTSIGYVKVAKIIEKLLNKIVDENKNYFKFFTLNN